MAIRNQRVCVWCGAVLIVLFTGGFLIAGFLPPPSPDSTAEQIKAIYVDHEARIHTGMLLCLLGSAFIIPWVVVISVQLKRIEGGTTGPLAWIQLTAGALGVLIFLFPDMVWQTAAFRAAQRPAEVTQALHDVGTLPFVGTPLLGVLQNVAIACAILQDRRSKPVFPRWVGYFNIWAALLFLPALVVVYFKTGPFAWDGLFAWWIPLTAFGAWFAVMIVMLLRAISDEEKHSSPAESPHEVRTADL